MWLALLADVRVQKGVERRAEEAARARRRADRTDFSVRDQHLQRADGDADVSGGRLCVEGRAAEPGERLDGLPNSVPDGGANRVEIG